MGRGPPGLPARPQEEAGVDAHFYFSLALIAFAFWLCYLYRNENRRK